MANTGRYYCSFVISLSLNIYANSFRYLCLYILLCEAVAVQLGLLEASVTRHFSRAVTWQVTERRVDRQSRDTRGHCGHLGWRWHHANHSHSQHLGGDFCHQQRRVAMGTDSCSCNSTSFINQKLLFSCILVLWCWVLFKTNKYYIIPAFYNRSLANALHATLSLIITYYK